MTARRVLLEAAKELLWERGYLGTSPGAIQAHSGAGQGSFYHHFRGKADLAHVALQAVAEDLVASLDRPQRQRSPLGRLHAFLTARRPALKGCRMGRMAMEPSIAMPEIAGPVAGYFRQTLARIEEWVLEAQRQGEIAPDLDAPEVARAVVAVVQGGYVLARALDDPAQLGLACRGAAALLEASGSRRAS